MEFLGAAQHAQVGAINAYQVEGNVQQHIHQVPPLRIEDMTLFELLEPIEDASHTRDRKQSPPDSACLPGTRVEVVAKVNNWARSSISSNPCHVYFMHGYVGSGKSAIALEVCEQVQQKNRLVASFFFFRNAGDRARIHRFATTLASQMAVALPETAASIRQAITDNPNLVRSKGARVSLAVQMERLVYQPFKDANRWGLLTVKALIGGPFVIVIDGLDECQDKDEVQSFIDGMLTFFRHNPHIPLRIFITSRVEQHIQSRLNVPEVCLDNLVNQCSDDDIATFLRILFEQEQTRNPVLAAYIRRHGEWPKPEDRRKLVEHIGGSFIFASAIFKFIMGSSTQEDPRTPMERLPFALNMNPGLDGLYADTLARSEHLPHFSDIIATIALVAELLSIAGIAEILEIETYEVVNVLANLQVIVQVPGTDDTPVTLCHTSLRDFLTTESRSERFFVPPMFHFRLFLRCFTHTLDHIRSQGRPSNSASLQEETHIGRYCAKYSVAYHWDRAQPVLTPGDLERAIPLLRDLSNLCSPAPEPPFNLAVALIALFEHTKSLAHIEEAVSLHRRALRFTPSHYPQYYTVVCGLVNALRTQGESTNTLGHYEEAISLCRRALKVVPRSKEGHDTLLECLAQALDDFIEHQGPGRREEVASLYRQALALRPPPHPDRISSLHKLGRALQALFLHTSDIRHLEERVSVYRDALDLRPFPNPDRPESLNSLGNVLFSLFRQSGSATHINEAISHYRQALILRPSPNPTRALLLNNLGNALSALFDDERLQIADIREAISCYREALDLRPAPHPDRPSTLQNLGRALCMLYEHDGTVSYIKEGISLYREALELWSPSSDRYLSQVDLADAHRALFNGEGLISLLLEAIKLDREALDKLSPTQSKSRPFVLNSLANALRALFEYSDNRDIALIEEAILLYREALELELGNRGSCHRDRAVVLVGLGEALRLRGENGDGSAEDFEEAIALHREALELLKEGARHIIRPWALTHQGIVMFSRFKKMGCTEDLGNATLLLRDSLGLYPSKDICRQKALTFTIKSLECLYERDRSLQHLKEAISLTRELLSKHFTIGHWRRREWVDKLISLLQVHVDVTGNRDDLSEITALKEELKE